MIVPRKMLWHVLIAMYCQQDGVRCAGLCWKVLTIWGHELAQGA